MVDEPELSVRVQNHCYDWDNLISADVILGTILGTFLGDETQSSMRRPGAVAGSRP
jgi:hypothetical protein